jgi:hypothetical protein
MQNLTDTIKTNLLEDVKSIFYDLLDLNEIKNQEKIHRALNYLFDSGYSNEPHWVDAFKSFIKGKVEAGDNSDFEIENKSMKVDWDKIKLNWEDLIIKPAKQKWEDTGSKLGNFYSKIKCVDKTLVYEAPPFKIKITIDEKGNLMSEFKAAHIFDGDCTSNYANAIKGNSDDTVQDILNSNKIGFFDVIPIPLPITSEMRKKWATHENYFIEGKRLFVHFFEWAKDAYLESIKLDTLQKDHQFAVGIPLNNAITLYEYFHDSKEECYEKFCTLNNPTENKLEGLWLPLYKNCIMGTSNTPSGELLRRHFNY